MLLSTSAISYGKKWMVHICVAGDKLSILLERKGEGRVISGEIVEPTREARDGAVG
jgi:hypothetical protein